MIVTFGLWDWILLENIILHLLTKILVHVFSVIYNSEYNNVKKLKYTQNLVIIMGRKIILYLGQ